MCTFGVIATCGTLSTVVEMMHDALSLRYSDHGVVSSEYFDAVTVKTYSIPAGENRHVVRRNIGTKTGDVVVYVQNQLDGCLPRLRENIVKATRSRIRPDIFTEFSVPR